MRSTVEAAMFAQKRFLFVRLFAAHSVLDVTKILNLISITILPQVYVEIVNFKAKMAKIR